MRTDWEKEAIPRKRENCEGMRFGILTALHFVKQDKSGAQVYLCQCECGNKKNILLPSLKKGATKSCGCLVKKRFCLRGHDTHKTGRTGRGCTVCMKIHGVSWANRNKAKVAVMRRERNWITNKILNDDGKQFSTVDYDRLYQIQAGCCAICRKHSTKFSRRLTADHNHATGYIRGLLCFKCNQGIGTFSDDIEKLRRALSYLEER